MKLKKKTRSRRYELTVSVVVARSVVRVVPLPVSSSIVVTAFVVQTACVLESVWTRYALQVDAFIQPTMCSVFRSSLLDQAASIVRHGLDTLDRVDYPTYRQTARLGRCQAVAFPLLHISLVLQTRVWLLVARNYPVACINRLDFVCTTRQEKPT